MTEGTVQIPVGRRRIIKRPRLTRLLDEANARLVLLVAPAGYGKTTLARQWLAEGRRQHAWYTADRSVGRRLRARARPRPGARDGRAGPGRADAPAPARGAGFGRRAGAGGRDPCRQRLSLARRGVAGCRRLPPCRSLGHGRPLLRALRAGLGNETSADEPDAPRVGLGEAYDVRRGRGGRRRRARAHTDRVGSRALRETGRVAHRAARGHPGMACRDRARCSRRRLGRARATNSRGALRLPRRRGLQRRLARDPHVALPARVRVLTDP